MVKINYAKVFIVNRTAISQYNLELKKNPILERRGKLQDKSPPGQHKHSKKYAGFPDFQGLSMTSQVFHDAYEPYEWNL